MWVSAVQMKDVRNIESAEIALGPGLNVFVGANAQGKTTILESVGLIARGRSFRAADARAMIRHGARRLNATAVAHEGSHDAALGIELTDDKRTFQVNGRDVAPKEHRGRLEVAVYCGERLRVLTGGMRERRQFLDRGAAALWPAAARVQREFERVLSQRNAALERRAPDQETWDERFVVLGGELRERRARYAARLEQEMVLGFRPAGERYAIRIDPGPVADVAGEEQRLRGALKEARSAERAAGRSLVGPQRDTVGMTVEGHDLAEASAGQARSMLLALTLAALDVYRAERGAAAVALLDDLDSELDDRRGAHVCEEFAKRGQALVTTAHPAWARALAQPVQVFEVAAGRVRSA
jgi:DNA replication and repair protein RecF